LAQGDVRGINTPYCNRCHVRQLVENLCLCGLRCTILWTPAAEAVHSLVAAMGFVLAEDRDDADQHTIHASAGIEQQRHRLEIKSNTSHQISTKSNKYESEGTFLIIGR
jgi:hypothetical protein